jgi:hypothetical protein
VNSIDPRFDKTVYLVEANDYERLSLWREHAINSGWSDKHVDVAKFVWQQENPGLWLDIGRVDGRPITLSFFWNTVNGRMVCFWESSSQLVDYKMIDEWFQKNVGDIPRTNAMNFHHVFSAIGY